MNKSFHTIIDDLSEYADVTSPKKLARFTLDHQQTTIFQISPSTDFLYGFMNENGDGYISVKKFSNNNVSRVYYTFGLKLKHPTNGTENTDYVAIIGINGYTLMDKTDAKSVFEFTRDAKSNSKKDEELLLKTIEVFCK